MAKGNFKQIDLLRKRRDSNYSLEPYFFDNTKYIQKGIFSGLILITVSLILGIHFIFRTKFLENKKTKMAKARFARFCPFCFLLFPFVAVVPVYITLHNITLHKIHIT